MRWLTTANTDAPTGIPLRGAAYGGIGPRRVAAEDS
ncbi:hypothetical protein BJY16_004815 [Actinoplanes octamycinicus]|uniref:Uncharacterized protein n=1 Tax=Actinoplanes octamycinicus TaxID=135948 RepID=A0A7W7GZU2_9ACTN|nr:hypothetical protein [Actinoplanes octamycinicus]